jgi:hypothetical protein
LAVGDSESTALWEWNLWPWSCDASWKCHDDTWAATISLPRVAQREQRFFDVSNVLQRYEYAMGVELHQSSICGCYCKHRRFFVIKSNSTRVGLGAGLGLGLAAIIGALIVFFWYNRRLKRKRKEARENDLRNLSMGASNFYSPRSEMGERRGAFPWSNGGWNGSNANEPVFDSTSAVAGYENLHAGRP